MMSNLEKHIFALILMLFVGIYSINAEVKNDSNQTHEITLFVMPTLHPLDWSGPAQLLGSAKSCYLKTITQSDNYLIGHLAVGIKSPLVPNPYYIAQASSSMQEKINMLYKQKIGLGILGASMQGRMETTEELAHKFKVYSQRKKLAFIKFKINKSALIRMLQFISAYKQKDANNSAPCDYYGGAFWPLFHNEGSGCSAFGMALLETANIHPTKSNEWLIDVNIPIELIGGEYNDGKKIRFSTIKKLKSWSSNDGIPNVDYVHHTLYEPSIMFDWILQKRNENDSIYKSIEENGIPGLLVDATGIDANQADPLFVKRTEQNLFIDHFMVKNLKLQAEK